MAIKLLLVDDHHIVRDGLKRLLEEDSRIEVVGEARDGAEAIRLARRLQPDLVIIDIAMPKVNGIAAIKSIKSENPDIEIIALSMHTQEHYVFGAIQAGAKGYLLKDNLTEDLFSAINIVLSGHYHISPQIAHVVVSGFIERNIKKEDINSLSPLSDREREVLQMLSEGAKVTQIADTLSISSKTVETHRRNIMEKTGAKNQVELIKYAFKIGLIHYDTWINPTS